MDLRPLALKDRKIFDKYLKNKPHTLAAYSFENTFVWRGLFELSWSIVNDNLCLFFKDKMGCFMNLPPLGRRNAKTLAVCFEAMERINNNKDISRLENIEEPDLAFFKKLEYRTYVKNEEYIVRTADTAVLPGERFKHKRNLVNFFTKNNKARLRDYETGDRGQVEALYDHWRKMRAEKSSDDIYRAMLGDSQRVLSELLEYKAGLNFQVKVVECDGKIRAFTSGFEISPRLFCINFEIIDLAYKGLAQFTFSEFAKTLGRYPEINIMDDSGIENIRKTKLLYRPTRIVPSYTALLAH